ncbi:SUKH-4 family immunity protein [Virgisporangium ochraceum]|uniref:Uncharacterized protein n=1 Tax=Virgisporangium ochraceum TaxID=65505 RepID=A0A8J4A0A3_9ACTN|nr:SUKH-4 family immunity protein [Virgisporangium ochraceum]GIJ72826.1 hypothetical protein Voc01_077430 [Virgisporangium ochraceum]
MNSIEEIRLLWGQLIPETGKIDAAVPENVRTFLTDVGLPAKPLWDLDFTRGEALRPFERDGRRCLPIAGYPAIRNSPYVYVFVADLATGALLQWLSDAIWESPPDPAEHPPAFVNSSVEQFLLTAGRYLAMIDILSAGAGDRATTERFYRNLESADPDALAPSGFWRFKFDELAISDA